MTEAPAHAELASTSISPESTPNGDGGTRRTVTLFPCTDTLEPEAAQSGSEDRAAAWGESPRMAAMAPAWDAESARDWQYPVARAWKQTKPVNSRIGMAANTSTVA